MSKETYERYTLSPHPDRLFIKPNKMTKFKAKWGIHAIDLAEREQISPDAIHMRIKKFGTPWQRRSKPTICEELTGIVSFQLAKILDIHPITVDERIREYNNPFVVLSDRPDAGKGRIPTSGTVWYKQDHFKNNIRAWKSWLAPEHPCYPEWKAKKTANMEKLMTEAVIIKQDWIKAQEKLQQEQI